MHPTELILGYPYLKAKNWLNKSEYYTRQHHLEFQKQKLVKLLKFSIRNIPFYREKVGDLVNEISNENAFEILKYFPFTSKSIIRKNLRQFTKKAWLRRLKATTGGSTASPMSFYMNRFVTRQTEKAYIWNLWARKGYKPGARIASFTGNVPKNDKLFDHNKIFNMFIFSPFDLTNEKIGIIISALNYFKPKFLHGYPSTLTSLANLIQKSDRQLSFKIKAVFCGSEKTFSHQREIIENVFGTKVLSW